MLIRLFFLICLSFLLGCKSRKHKITVSAKPVIDSACTNPVSYDQMKVNVRRQKLFFSKTNFDLDDQANLNLIRDYWVNALLHNFYSKWANTGWDFNGTTEQPGVGKIACGFFVTTLLQDMGVKLSRVKLAVCPSSKMMKTLVPGQKLMNLSSLSFNDFNEKVSSYGKGVFIIGLDFHTGFIINDGTQNWFLHLLQFQLLELQLYFH